MSYSDKVRRQLFLASTSRSLIVGNLGQNINRNKYLTSCNAGFAISTEDDFCVDIAILEKTRIGKLKGKYFDLPPKVVIEVDIKADTAEFENGADGYVMQKARKLLDFGVEKVLWIITSMQRVYVIDRNDPTWHIVDWSETIAVVDDSTLNIKQLLDDEIVY